MAKFLPKKNCLKTTKSSVFVYKIMILGKTKLENYVMKKTYNTSQYH